MTDIQNEINRRKGTQNVHQKFTARQNELRLFIINFIVDNHRPYNIDGDKAAATTALSISGSEYQEIINCLLDKDGMVINDNKDVNFIYPVSSLDTNHHVKLADGREFTAMCAIDAIGAAFTFHQDTEVNSVCALSKEPVYIKIENERVIDYSPKELHALTFPLGELTNWAGSC